MGEWNVVYIIKFPGLCSATRVAGGAQSEGIGARNLRHGRASGVT